MKKSVPAFPPTSTLSSLNSSALRRQRAQAAPRRRLADALRLRIAISLGLPLGFAACVDLGPHAPFAPMPAGSQVVASCRSPSPLPSGRLFTDITEAAGLKGITGVRVASADPSRNSPPTTCPHPHLRGQGHRLRQRDA